MRKTTTILTGLILLLSLAAGARASAQELPEHAGPQRDSTAPKSHIRPYKEVITAAAITRKGLFTVHHVGEKYYFEIPDSIMRREILAVTRFSKVMGGAMIYGGEIANQQTVAFERGPDKNVFLRDIIVISMADTTNTISQAVANSDLSPIAAAFPIAAYGDHSTVIDVTDFFRSDNQVINIPPKGRGLSKERLSLTNIQSDRTYINSIHTYPTNTEVNVVKTYAANGGSYAGALSGAVTMELNTSFLLLASVPMRQRLFDPRVGYFADDYLLYGDDQQRVKDHMFAIRWRLEPKPEDMEKYKRGELVEPARPIVYYIDPATPKQWRPYLIQGINDWQKAFEQAGFKNAIVGKEWPEGDTTMSLEDARFSVLRYFASPVENAYGPNVHDPRSGEILESHIGWYHNVMQLMHDWYMVQCGAVDPGARKMVFSDSLMGQLIRFVSSHEVGHTLGLRHNMGASSATPVAKLRDKAWVEAHGHTASIMDYARFNYVAQPEDSIGETGLFPRINDYDKWAIQWGYTYTGEDDAEKDRKTVNRWTVDSLKNPRLWFGGEGRNNDPRAQAEDLGDNPMEAGAYGILNLKRILPQLPGWTREEGSEYENLGELYVALCAQFGRYIEHVAVNIGGQYETLRSVEQPGSVYAPVPKLRQQQAMAFLTRELFQTPHWLLDTSIMNKVYPPTKNNGYNPVANLQTRAVSYLLATFGGPMVRLQAMTARFGAAGTYTMEEMLSDLRKGMLSELQSPSHVVADVYRRNLQDFYIDNIISAITPPMIKAPDGSITIDMSAKWTDVGAALRSELMTIRSQLRPAIPLTADPISKAHWVNLAARIDDALDKNKR